MTKASFMLGVLNVVYCNQGNVFLNSFTQRLKKQIKNE